MKFEKVSVLVPTRGRLKQLQRMIESYQKMTEDGPAELLFRVDYDDQETRDFLKGTPLDVFLGPRLDGYRSLPAFFENLRHMATGDLFLTGNDDMVFQTPDWAHLVLEEANKYPDGIFDLGVKTYNERHFPFAIVSRHAVDLIGFIHSPELMWGDLFLRDVMAAFGRAIMIPQVRIDHEWMGKTPDAVFMAGDQGNKQYWNRAYKQKHLAIVSAAVARIDADHRVGPV